LLLRDFRRSFSHFIILDCYGKLRMSAVIKEREEADAFIDGWDVGLTITGSPRSCST